MSKLFIGFVNVLPLVQLHETNHFGHCRGLAWHTEDATLRQKFEEFGPVEEAVCHFELCIFQDLAGSSSSSSGVEVPRT